MSVEVLIFGADGQVGYELCRLSAGRSVVAITRQHCDLRDEHSVRQAIRSVSPKVIINAAGYTAVDRAESEPELAQAINAIAPGIMAEEAARSASLMIHYSTDYVFSGEKADAYVEEDPTGPINVYGRSKLAGEQVVRNGCQHHVILRTSWVFSARRQNFVRTMLSLGRERDQVRVVADQHGVPTSAAALGCATWDAIAIWFNADAVRRRELSGTYHAVAGPATNWHAFAVDIFLQARSARIPLQVKDVVAITTADYPTPAVRPRNSVLCGQRLRERFGVQMHDWRQELQTVVMQLHDSPSAPLQSQ